MPGVQIPPVIAAATRRSAVAWVEDDGRVQPVWQLWHRGRMFVVAGGEEQPLSVGAHAVVAVREREHRDLQVRWVATIEQVHPGSPLWAEVVPLLHARRLNAPDGEAQPGRWARTSRIYCFTPTGELLPL